MVGKQPESWVAANNIIAVHSKDGERYKLKTFRIRQGSRTIDAKVYDHCADSDCNGCCTRNAQPSNFLIGNYIIKSRRYIDVLLTNSIFPDMETWRNTPRTVSDQDPDKSNGTAWTVKLHTSYYYRHYYLITRCPHCIRLNCSVNLKSSSFEIVNCIRVMYVINNKLQVKHIGNSSPVSLQSTGMAIASFARVVIKGFKIVQFIPLLISSTFLFTCLFPNKIRLFSLVQFSL